MTPVNYSDGSGTSPKWWNWVISGVLLVDGIILCATGIGSVAGVGLIVAGTSSLISNIMDAAGVDSKLANQISAGIDIFAGLILLYTPFAGIGAAMIGSGIGSFGGGYISEALGGNYEFGSLIGSILGGAVGNGIYKGLQKIGVVSVRVKLDSLKFNPLDEFVKEGPSERALNYWTKTLAQNPNGYNMIPNIKGIIEPVKIIRSVRNVWELKIFI